jgi:hypothetical protein
MNLAFWFMVVQVATCLGGAIGFGLYSKNYPLAWVWLCYALANVGFAVAALKVAA